MYHVAEITAEMTNGRLPKSRNVADVFSKYQVGIYRRYRSLNSELRPCQILNHHAESSAKWQSAEKKMCSVAEIKAEMTKYQVDICRRYRSLDSELPLCQIKNHHAERAAKWQAADKTKCTTWQKSQPK